MGSILCFIRALQGYTLGRVLYVGCGVLYIDMEALWGCGGVGQPQGVVWGMWGVVVVLSYCGDVGHPVG